MPRIDSRSLVWAFAVSVGLWTFLGQGQNAAANSSYRGLWEGKEDVHGRIIQRHDNIFSFNIDQTLSERLLARENINYGYQWQQEVGARETVSPGASLTMDGGLFHGNLAVNSVKNLNSQALQPDSDTVGISWASRWQKPLVPDFRLSYDYSRYTLDNRNIDDGNENVGGEVRWNLQLLQINYSYRRDKSTFTDYQFIQDSHVTRVNASRVWLDNRLRLTLGHEYGESRSESIISGSAATANVKVYFTSAFTGIESLPVNPTTIPPDTSDAAPYLLSNPDSPLIGTSFPISADGNNHVIRLENTSGNPVDHIFLYTLDNLGSTPAASMPWQIYFNDGDYTVIPWTQVSGIVVTYDIASQRYVVQLPAALDARYIKLVAHREFDSTSVAITEVKAEWLATADQVTKSKTNKSNFNFAFKLNNSVSFYYNFLTLQEDNNEKSIIDTQNHSGGIRLQNSPGDLKSNLSYTLSKSRYRDTPETRTQAYLIDINKMVFPTLTLAFGGSHEDRYLDGIAISDRNHFTFYTDAKLYPDLTSRLEVMYWIQNSYKPGLAEIQMDAVRTQLTVTSRFRPSLVVTFAETFELQKQNNVNFEKKNSIILTGSWQLSEWFSVNGTIQRDDSLITSDANIYSLAMVAGLGAGLEFKVNYALKDSDKIYQTGQASLRWSFHPNVSWEAGCDYAETGNDDLLGADAEENLYKVYSKVIVGFGT